MPIDDEIHIALSPRSMPRSVDDVSSILLRIESLLQESRRLHQFRTGRVIFDTSGQTKRIEDDTSVLSLVIIADSSNIGDIFVGDANQSEATGLKLPPGASVSLSHILLSSLSFYGETSGDSFTWAGEY